MKPDKANQLLRTLPIASWEWPRVIMAVPIERTLSHASYVFPRFLEIVAQGVPFIKQNYTRTVLARNNFAAKFLETSFTHLLMLDADHVHPIDIVQRLARWVLLDPDKLVVGGLNFRRSEPFEPCAFFTQPDTSIAAPAEWAPGLMRVDYLGTGSILIAREVFERIRPPWFYDIYDDDHIMADVWPGEDIGFSENCRKAGIDLWMDTTTTSPHLTESFVTEETFRAYMKAHPDKYHYVDEKPSEANPTQAEREMQAENLEIALRKARGENG